MTPIFKHRPNKVHNINGKDIWESRSPAVVAFIFALYKDELYILGEKRSENMPQGPGRWVAPCGYMDWDESGWNALRREVYEETSFFIDTYKKYIIYDNNKEPFFVKTDPNENLQNVALNYSIFFDFDKRKSGIPYDIEAYSDKEVSQVKWILYNEVSKYDWAFEHDIRIEMAIQKCNLL